MSESKAFTLDLKDLETLERMFKKGVPGIDVGIMGDKDNRKDSESNATIGEYHEQEFGSSGQEQRSFLRMPLETKLKEFLEKSNLNDTRSMEKFIKEKTMKGLSRALGKIAEEVIQEAFKTGGFGKWTPSNMDYKDNDQTLVETGQLRRSIKSKVHET